MRLKVENESGLVRDQHSKAIINVDPVQFNAYLKKRDSIIQEKQISMQNKQDILQLKSDMDEIKSQLNLLLSSINNIQHLIGK